MPLRYGSPARGRALQHAEWLALLLDREVTMRRQKRFEARARAARLRHRPASRMSISAPRAASIAASSSSSPAASGSVPGTGCCSPGQPASARAGWLALGHKACREDLSVAYHRAPRLFAALALARNDGRYGKMLRGLARVDLLILDDWGPERLDDQQRRDLLEIVEDRHERRSTIVTSQLPVDR